MLMVMILPEQRGYDNAVEPHDRLNDSGHWLTIAVSCVRLGYGARTG